MNSEMERYPEWFDRKSTSSGFVIYNVVHTGKNE